MHGHWRWFVAAAAAALAGVVSSPQGAARTHRHAHTVTHPAPQPAPPPAAPQAAPSAPAAAPAPAAANPDTAKPDTTMPAAAAPETPAGRVAYGKAGTSAIVLDTKSVQAVLGKVVRSSAGEDMGRLVDVVVDRDGRPRAAIIDFGGFLGVGSRKIAVDWGALNFSRGADSGVIAVALTRDQVKSAPEFKEGSPVVALGASAHPPDAAAPPPRQDARPPAPAAAPQGREK